MPIVGTTSLKNLEDIIGELLFRASLQWQVLMQGMHRCTECGADPEDMKYLKESYKPLAVFGPL